MTVVALVKWFKNFRSDENGATAVEYAVMLSLIAAVVLVGVGNLTGAVRDSYDSTGKAVEDAIKPKG